jgi:hypothetical protein
MSAVLDVSCPPRSYIRAGFIPPKLSSGDPALAINSSTAFLSYSRSDSDFALKLAEDLQAAGASVWLDQIELEPGRPWDIEIQRALMACNRMLVVLSPASVNSTNVLDEVSFALKKQKTVIPVLYQDCEIPLRLDRLQYVNLINYDRGMRILLKSLAERGQPIPVPIVPTPVVATPVVSNSDVPARRSSDFSSVPPTAHPQPQAEPPIDDPGARRNIIRDLDAILNAGRPTQPVPPPPPPQPKPDAGLLDELSRLISRSGH